MKTNEVAVLENEVTLMGKTFNVYGTVEEPLFKAKDVAEWIEHSNVSAMVQSVDEDEKLTLNIAYSEQQKHMLRKLGKGKKLRKLCLQKHNRNYWHWNRRKPQKKKRKEFIIATADILMTEMFTQQKM